MLASCQPATLEEHYVEIHPVLAPQVLGAFDAPATRAIDLEHPNYYNGFTGLPGTHLLPDGSTVWLLFRKATVASPDPANPAHWDSPDLKAYVVDSSEEGFHALAAIPFSENNGILTVGDKTQSMGPLYLKDGTYQFRLVSPAYDIRRSDFKMFVENGMYLYSNDERYEQTKNRVYTVSGDDGVEAIVLNPIISQVARLEITLTPRNNVHVLEMMPQGIEISGLQNPGNGTDGTLFNWSSLNLADTLKMKRGEKGSSVFIKEFTTDESGVIHGDVGILPTNAMSTMVTLLINAAVNGIPTQYIVTLSQMKFFHGHSYKLDLDVDINGDIYVMNWANQSWSDSI